MDKIIKDLIYENHSKHDCLVDLLWEFTDMLDEDGISDLLEAISFNAIMDYLDDRKIYYKGSSILDVANLYILILAQEIIKIDFPKLYSEVKA
jgi:hypothetical protein